MNPERLAELRDHHRPSDAEPGALALRYCQECDLWTRDGCDAWEALAEVDRLATALADSQLENRAAAAKTARDRMSTEIGPRLPISRAGTVYNFEWEDVP
mgnify:CR=1 FL=1